MNFEEIKKLLDEDADNLLKHTCTGIPKFLDIKGSNLGGVYYGEEFLMRVEHDLKNEVFYEAPSNHLFLFRL